MKDNIIKDCVIVLGEKVVTVSDIPKINKISSKDVSRILNQRGYTSNHGKVFDSLMFQNQDSKSCAVSRAEVIQTFLDVLKDEGIDIWELEDGFNIEKRIHRGIVHKILVHLSIQYEDRGMLDVWDKFKAERSSCKTLLDVVNLAQRVKK